MEAANTTAIEDIYALSPLQRGILFHSLSDLTPGMYMRQVMILIEGPVDVALFQQAWQHVVDRHTILRSSVQWSGLREPVQIVHRKVRVSISLHDWRELPPVEQERQWNALLKEEQEHSVDPGKPPLMRLMLVRLTSDSHQFIWSYHHLLLDGWSIPLVLQEVFACYDAAIAGNAPSLPPARPFRDYIAWLRHQSLPAAEAFWRQELAGLEEPGLLWETSSDGTGAGQQTRDLGYERTRALHSLSSHYRLTLNTICQGAWSLLLSRRRGQAEVVFGTTVTERPAELEGAQQLVGLCINTLPVRVRIAQEQPLINWLGELQQRQVQARQYEYAPLGQVQQWSGLPGGTPLFESLLLFENYPLASSATAWCSSLHIKQIKSTEQIHYPLTLVVLPGASITAEMTYDRTRLSDEAAAQLFQRFEHLLDDFIRVPESPLQELTGLREEKQQLLLMSRSASVASHLPGILAQITEQTRLTPDAIALVEGEHSLSYRVLDLHSNQLAVYLKKAGVGTEIRVGIHIQRSLEMIIALLGVWKAGGAFVPLDPTYPSEHTKFIIQDAQLAIIITSAGLRNALEKVSSAHLFCLGSEQVSLMGLDEALSEENPHPEQTAYMICTSGSTGRPKGVLVPHRALVATCFAVSQRYHICADDRVLQFSSLSFDASLEEIFPPLCNGATVVLLPGLTALTAQEWPRLLTEQALTLLDLPTVYWREWLFTLSLIPVPFPSSIRLVIIGGEAASKKHLQRWIQLVPPTVGWLNTYGPTETTITATTYQQEQGEADRQGASVPIGRPLPHVEAYVLDERMRLLPMGAVGELYLGGSGVARGYLDLPELTAQCFVPHPFSSQPGARLYRTGDLVCWQDEGCLAFVGRRDQQVKVRGFRMELGEIEATLEELLPIRAAIVLVQQEEEQERTQLVACVVSLPGTRLSLGQVRAALGKRLPGHMLPNRLATLEQMPTLPNGKTDRQRVAELVRETSEEEEEGKEEPEPASEVERVLLTIWKQVLRRERVGLRTNFFDLGGNSLLLFQVQVRIQEELRLSLSPVDLLHYPSIELLAHYLNGKEAKSSPVGDDKLIQSIPARNALLREQRQLRRHHRETRELSEEK